MIANNVQLPSVTLDTSFSGTFLCRIPTVLTSSPQKAHIIEEQMLKVSTWTIPVIPRPDFSAFQKPIEESGIDFPMKTKKDGLSTNEASYLLWKLARAGAN